MDAVMKEEILASMRMEVAAIVSAALAPLTSRLATAGQEPQPGPSSRPDHPYADVANYEDAEESEWYEEEPEEQAAEEEEEQEHAESEAGMQALEAAVQGKDEEGGSDPVNILKQLTTGNEKIGPKLNDAVAEACKTLIETGLPEKKLTELLDKYDPPENCAVMAPVRVNGPIWEIIRETTKGHDKRWQRPQMLLAKAMVAVAKAMEDIKAAAADKPSLNTTFATMAEGFAIMATSNKEINLKRREYIRADLAPSYKALCKRENPITKELFGDNLEEAIKSKYNAMLMWLNVMALINGALVG
jgi:hypothetical protein